VKNSDMKISDMNADYFFIFLKYRFSDYKLGDSGIMSIKCLSLKLQSHTQWNHWKHCKRA